MGESELFLDRQCHKCHGVFNVSSAALRLHVDFCKATQVKVTKQVFKPQIPVALPRVSNRERQRMASRAILREQEHKLILLAVLAQCGGEKVVTAGTITQLTEDMNYEVVPNPGDVDGTERIVRIVK